MGDNSATITVDNESKIVIAGGGPAGAFFAISLLRKAKEQGKALSVTIIERKKERHFSSPEVFREGCNYCAGGISPRMFDILDRLGLSLPEEIIQSRVDTITVQGDWKNFEMKVPAGKNMALVYRGSRPKNRENRHFNFDSYLLGMAMENGAKVITGEVYNVEYYCGKPVLSYKTKQQSHSITADFVAFATGVNQKPGADPAKNVLFSVLQKLIVNFKLPKVRKTLIFELELEENFMSTMQGELHFVEYGSRDLKIEMSSLAPKGKFMTVVLLGPSVDSASISDSLPLIERFLSLPHIKRLLPGRVQIGASCMCTPNMTVGTAKNPAGHRVAIVGDMVTSRLYKDGLLSAYSTASSLADTILTEGIDAISLRRGYLPTIRKFRIDNEFGKLVFMINRISFRSPVLSRIFYQAMFTERKTRDKGQRKLEKILWSIASGEDDYQKIFFSLFQPKTIFSIISGGVLITMRNYLTERVFGLDWKGFGRYPTGVYKESLEAKRKEFAANLQLAQLRSVPELERIYTIRIKTERQKIFEQLGKFGDVDKGYFKPRMIKVRRISGNANEVGSIIQYDTPFEFTSFSIVLEEIVKERYLVYRIRDGFATNGVLVFDVNEQGEKDFLLSIYVAFNFIRGDNLPKKSFWLAFRLIFPGFVHDVLWNHALCRLKNIAENGSFQ